MLLAMLIRRVAPLIILPLLTFSCAPPAREGGFESRNSAAKMYAMEQAVIAGDRNAAKDIVEQLDSDDPAVRMMAIESLQRLTGKTLGYDHSASRAERREAIERWVKAVESDQTVEAARPASDNGTPDG